MRSALLLGAVLIGCGSSPVVPEESTDPPVPRECPAISGGAETFDLAGGLADARRAPHRTIVLMGGGREHDTASRRFVEAANAGDVLVLRASGSLTSYPEYFGQQLDADPAPRTVRTIKAVGAAGGDAGVLCKVRGAEAIWLAGGDQWRYLGGWPDTLHEAISARADSGAAIGGTSAGAMVLGEAAFDARNASVTSQEALADPDGLGVTIMRSPVAQDELAGILVDTHFSERNREGRLLAFMARFQALVSRDEIHGLGLDEGVAVTISADSLGVHSSGGAAWFYRAASRSTTDSGPLEFPLVLRQELPGGYEGVWPPDPASPTPDTLRVIGGAIR
ncbi:MAG: Type 1 glutamine amidotransferase-like domain-containing protein [Rhodothermales bacterium]|nr:Type 1 glutamine amidotransferase-like domain-containing protein [Rhodothermales bacterium]MBO6780764.1 Type 1 glutamine amidotransferase-like domain-containing protein [Rhodothermales bacterium]